MQYQIRILRYYNLLLWNAAAALCGIISIHEHTFSLYAHTFAIYVHTCLYMHILFLYSFSIYAHSSPCVYFYLIFLVVLHGYTHIQYENGHAYTLLFPD